MSDSPFPRLQRAAANFGLAVASTLILLGALEGGLRLFDRLHAGTPLILPDPGKDLYMTHPYLPTVLRPSTEYEDADTTAHINALGLRGPERAAAKPPGTWRVLCVGGSTTFGAGIRGDENTWPARLESRLSAAFPDRHVEVLNAGVPGYTTAENVIYLSLRLVDLQPDLVVLYEGYNDFKPNRHPGFASDYSHWRDREAPPPRPVGERSRIVTKLRTALAGFAPPPDAPVRDPRSQRALPRHDTVTGEGRETFRRNLRTMIATARAAGAQVALATYPHPCTEENLARAAGHFQYLPQFVPGLTFHGVIDAFDRYNEDIRAVARQEEALLADAAASIPADLALFVDHVHFNAAGADRFAAVVSEAVLSAGPGP